MKSVLGIKAMPDIRDSQCHSLQPTMEPIENSSKMTKTTRSSTLRDIMHITCKPAGYYLQGLQLRTIVDDQCARIVPTGSRHTWQDL